MPFATSTPWFKRQPLGFEPSDQQSEMTSMMNQRMPRTTQALLTPLLTTLMLGLTGVLAACGSSRDAASPTVDGGSIASNDDANIGDSQDATTGTAEDASPAEDASAPDPDGGVDGAIVDGQDASPANDATIVADGGPSIVDGGSEDAAVVDAGPPARALVEVKLFGEVPVDNLVLNPQFDMLSQTWLAVGDISSRPRYLAPRYRVFGQSPAHQPAVMFDGSTAESALIGSVMASGSPLQVSVWVGRNLADAATIEDIRPALIMTLAATGQEQIYELSPDPATSTATLDEIRWRKYTGYVQDASIGTLTMLIYDGTAKPWYVEAPVVQQGSQFRGGAPALRPRKLSAAEAYLSQEMAKWRRRRLGQAPNSAKAARQRTPMLKAKP